MRSIVASVRLSICCCSSEKENICMLANLCMICGGGSSGEWDGPFPVSVRRWRSCAWIRQDVALCIPFEEPSKIAINSLRSYRINLCGDVQSSLLLVPVTRDRYYTHELRWFVGAGQCIPMLFVARWAQTLRFNSEPCVMHRIGRPTARTIRLMAGFQWEVLRMLVLSWDIGISY